MISDRIAKRLLIAHKDKLNHAGAKNWDPIYSLIMNDLISDIDDESVTIGFESKASLECEIASDPRSQTIGLQKYASLPAGYGMAFPFSPPRYAAFHMASVPFPIDMIFVGADSRIIKTVEHVQPGELGSWGADNVAMVIEAAAGFCEANNIMLGSKVATLRTALVKHAEELGFMPAFYDMKERSVHSSPGTHLTFIEQTGGADDFDWDRYVDGFMDTKGRFYTREQIARIVKSSDPQYTSEDLYNRAIEDEPQHNVNVTSLGFVPLKKNSQETFPDYPLKGVNTKPVDLATNPNNERFKGRDLVDVQLDSQQMDPANYGSTLGHDPSKDTIETSVTRPN